MKRKIAKWVYRKCDHRYSKLMVAMYWGMLDLGGFGDVAKEVYFESKLVVKSIKSKGINHADEPTKKIICPDCGKEVKADDDFCPDRRHK